MHDKIVRVGIAVIAFNSAGSFLMGQRLNTHGAGQWAVPGGTLEFGESFADCARRETREETGLDIDRIEILSVANHIFPEHGKHFVALFCAACIIGDALPQRREPDKCAGWSYFDDWHDLPQPPFVPYHEQVGKHLIEDYRRRHCLRQTDG